MKDKRLTILVVDDQPDDAEIVRRLLKTVLDGESEILVAHSQDDALEILSEKRVEAIILDYLLGKNTGLDVLREIKGEDLDIPILVMTGHEDARVAAELIRAGADEYLVKNDVDANKLRESLTNAMNSCAQRRHHKEEMESKLHHAERLATVGQTVAGVSHTIKGILTTLKGSASLVEKAINNGDMETLQNLWKVYKRSNDRMESLVHDMLDYSKEKKLEKKDVDVSGLLRNLGERLSGYAEKNSVRVVLRTSSKVPVLSLDEEAITTALESVAENAIQAMGEKGGGTLEIISRRSKNRRNVVISIIDDGPGIPRENLSRIFDPFYTTKGSEGTGLGLAVAHKHVIAHGGRVELESRPGRTAFSFRLPIHSDHVSEVGDQTNVAFLGNTG